MKTETFNVPAVSCNHCVNAITQEVGALDGVSKVDVNLNTKVVTVEANDSVKRDQISAAIGEAGYDVVPFTNSIPLS